MGDFVSFRNKESSQFVPDVAELQVLSPLNGISQHWIGLRVRVLLGSRFSPTIMDTLGLSKSTTYEYANRLVDHGLLERDDSTRLNSRLPSLLSSSSRLFRSSSRRPPRICPPRDQ